MWDIKSETCIQTETFKFPAFKIHGKTIEWGVNSIYPGPKRVSNLDQKDSNITSDIGTKWLRSHIIIACCNYIATINMLFLDEKHRSNFELPVLIPPPLQNSVLIPNSWKTADEKDLIEKELDSDMYL